MIHKNWRRSISKWCTNRNDVSAHLNNAKALNDAMKKLKDKFAEKLLLNKVVITLTAHLNIKTHTIKHYRMPKQSLIKIVILH